MDNSRRTFIKKSTLGVAAMTVGGVGMSAKSYGRIIGANDRLVIAIAGLGRRLHQGGVVEPIAMKENNVHLKYFCDVMESQRTRAAEKYSGVLGYTPALESDIRRIFDDKEVDLLVNQMPDHWHTPGACYAVQAGKHVYLEKPTSHNPYEGELLVQFQKKYGKLIQTGNQGSS
ncbi:MAG: Gfo/Idh/MocA family oxidoreductase, partial [Mariniphaga sp.]